MYPVVTPLSTRAILISHYHIVCLHSMLTVAVCCVIVLTANILWCKNLDENWQYKRWLFGVFLEH